MGSGINGVHEQTHIFYVMAYSGCLGPFQDEPHCKTFSTTTPKEDTTTPKDDTTTPKDDTTTPKEDTTTPKDDTTTPEENNTTPKEDNITTKGSSASIIQSALGFNLLLSILLWKLLE